MKGQGFQADIGKLRTFVAPDDSILTVEQWAEILSSRIISVGNESPAFIRDQALAVQREIALVCQMHIKQIRDEVRDRDALLARRGGSEEIAAAILGEK